MSFLNFFKKNFSKNKKKKETQPKDQYPATPQNQNNNKPSRDTQAHQASAASTTKPIVTFGEAQPAQKKNNDLQSTSATPASQQENKPTAPNKKKQKRSFFASIKRLFLGRPTLDDALLDELEELLITRDMGVKTANKLIKKLKKRGCKPQPR